MHLFRSKIFIIIFLFSSVFIFSEASMDDLVVDKIYNIFLKEYDNLKDKSTIEKIVLRMGRKAYIDNLILWKQNYKDINKIKFSLHPIMESMAKIGDKGLEKEKGVKFRSLLEDLTRISFKHFNIYYLALKEYIIENKLKTDDIKLDIFADALAKEKFYNEKLKLFKEEFSIEDEIALMMKDKKIKYRIAFYAFAFDFFIDIRKKIVHNEEQDMFKRIEEKAGRKLK